MDIDFLRIKLFVITLHILLCYSPLKGEESDQLEQYRKDLQEAGYALEEIDVLIEKEMAKRSLIVENPLPEEVQTAVDEVENSISKEVHEFSKAIEVIKKQTIIDMEIVQRNLLRNVTTTNMNEALNKAIIVRQQVELYRKKDLKSCFFSKQIVLENTIDITEDIVKKFNKKIDAKKQESLKRFEKVKVQSLKKLENVQKKIVQKGDLDKAIAINKVFKMYEKINLKSYVIFMEGYVKDEQSDISHLEENLKKRNLSIKEIEGLKTLLLPSSNLNNNDMCILVKHLNVIETLKLPGNDFTDEALQLFKDIPTLRHLGLRNTKITIKGAMHLKGTNIEYLVLPKNNFTREEINQVVKALPKCEVRFIDCKLPVDQSRPLKHSLSI